MSHQQLVTHFGTAMSLNGIKGEPYYDDKENGRDEGVKHVVDNFELQQREDETESINDAKDIKEEQISENIRIVSSTKTK